MPDLRTRAAPRRRFALLLALAAAVLPLLAAAPAAQAAERYRISATANVRAAPSTAAQITGRVFANEMVTLLCQQRGTTVRGNSTWDYIEYRVGATTRTKRGFVSDVFVSTGRSGPVPGAPQGNCTGGNPPPPPPPPPDTLRVGQVMHPGHALTSRNGQYRLVMQHDGNLVLYATAGNRPLWGSDTWNRPGATATLQPDGNLVIHHHGRPIWGAGAHGRGGTSLRMQDDRNVVIYRDNGTGAWATETMRTTGWIEHATWYRHDQGLFLRIRRTGKAIHGPLDLQSAFDESLAMAPVYRQYENWTYRSLYMQFRCHDDIFVSRRMTDFWDIDDWRHEVNYRRMKYHNCNPRGPGVTTPPFPQPAP